MDDCKTLGIKIFHSKQIADSVQRFVMCQETPFVSKNVWDHIKRELGVIISNKTMSKFLKTKLRMSFKKASFRSSRLDVKRQQILKTLFAVYLAKQITDDSLLVNIDECYFSRQTKNCYTWLKRSLPGSIKNIIFQGSLNLLTAITSSGSSYSAVLKGKTDSKMYVNFLEKLLNEIEEKEKISRDRLMIIMDNAPIHQAKLVLNYLDNKKINCIFLPQYTPELAPVEIYFGWLKRQVKTNVNDLLKLDSEEGLKAIIPARVRKLWKHFYRKIKEWLWEATLIGTYL